MPARHLRHQVRGRRRDDDRVGVAREPDMADLGLVLAVEQVGVGARPGERGGRERRHELLRARGQDAAHAGAALAQPPDEIERLVGGDAAADDEEDAPSCQTCVEIDAADWVHDRRDPIGNVGSLRRATRWLLVGVPG